MHCATCGHTNAPHARFCAGCGAPIATPASTFQEPPICIGCGVLVDASRRACATCGTPYASPPPRAIPQPGGGYWVAVRATFTCNACRFDVPLNHFELGDGAVCTRCGLEQRYDSSNWEKLVELAHAVGDLGALGPEGRFPDPSRPLPKKPFPDLGISESWAGRRDFRASPGNPICRTCKAPLVVVGKAGPRLDVACSRCGERHAYEVPPKAHALFPSLAGVLADEHEAARREAAIVDERGVMVLRCPNCSAPLTGVKDDDGTVHCGYCHVPCRISTDTHARIGHKQTPIKTWWLYFDQPSHRRRELHDAEAARAAEAREEEAERRARAQSERERAEKRAAREAAATANAKAAERRAMIPLLSVMVMAPIVGGVIYWQSLHRQKGASAAAAARPSDEVLNRYSFTMTPQQASAVFGVQAMPGASIKLKEPGVFKEVRLGGAGGPTYSLDLLGGAQFDMKAAHARLLQMAPNRLHIDVNGQDEISVGKSILRVDGRPTPMYTGRVEVMTWLPGEAGAAAADALLAVARYATMNGPKPTAEQLRLVNGPPLSDAAKIDPKVTTESASKGFLSVFPFGECKTVTNLAVGKTLLTCSADVDHPLFKTLRLSWPNVPEGHLQWVSLVLAQPEKGQPKPDPTGCLTGALGSGQTKVVDFASGRSERTWTFGARGDRAALDGSTFDLLVRDRADPAVVPDWAAQYPKLLEALAACSR